MPVRPIDTADYPAFRKLFCDYFTELDCEDDPEYTFDEFLLPDLEAENFSVAVAEAEGRLVGFVIYQIDELLNAWHFKEGFGDVREIYVAPLFRKRGLGSELLKFAEDALKAEGADGVYTLPVEESEAFFSKRGYSDTGEYCSGLDNKVFGKNLL
ncbi:MAG: GNAT family N-acetyltransferase [Clostridia bacterium]|nr:GNAT family N-acetyltransferase [Clostridia bacterium]